MINKNSLHYYVDLLRKQKREKQTRQNTESCISALHNIIRTMKYARCDKICDEDFSHLDFGNIPFNDIHFSINGKMPSNFIGRKLNEWNFTSGHTGSILDVTFSPDGKIVATASEDVNVILWDSKNALMIRKL